MIVVIPTCDAYADILGPFVYCWEKNWGDCPYRKVFINSPRDFPGFENFRTHADRGWTANLLEFLETEDVKENICLLLDDYLLVKPIQTAEVARADAFVRDKVGCIRLIPYSDNDLNSGQGWKWPSRVSHNEWYNVADMDPNSPKKLTRLPISLQPAVWNSAFVRTFFNPEWSPWQQEVLASRELCKTGTIRGVPCDYLLLTTKEPVYAYVNGIRDGKYSRDFVELIDGSPPLQPFTFARHIAIPEGELSSEQKKALLARQTDGTYPQHHYG